MISEDLAFLPHFPLEIFAENDWVGLANGGVRPFYEWSKVAFSAEKIANRMNFSLGETV